MSFIEKHFHILEDDELFITTSTTSTNSSISHTHNSSQPAPILTHRHADPNVVPPRPPPPRHHQHGLPLHRPPPGSLRRVLALGHAPRPRNHAVALRGRLLRRPAGLHVRGRGRAGPAAGLRRSAARRRARPAARTPGAARARAARAALAVGRVLGACLRCGGGAARGGARGAGG